MLDQAWLKMNQNGGVDSFVSIQTVTCAMGAVRTLRCQPQAKLPNGNSSYIFIVPWCVSSAHEEVKQDAAFL